MDISRRLLFRRAVAAAAVSAGAAAFARPPRAQTPTRSRFVSDPFSLGVASGDPAVDGAVIWTRLAPDPLDPDGLGSDTHEVRWRVARDANMRDVVRSGRALAAPERAHTIHVELSGLEPDRPYWYRFEAGGAQSPTGRLFTLPEPGRRKEALKLAWASCQHYEQGWFNAYQDMVAWDPRLILHLGDYIYESSWGVQTRRHPTAEPFSVDDYRLQHAVYKLDRDLQAAHRLTSWAFIWDDHEVENDYAALVPENPVETAQFAARRAAAYRAYFEHMPISRRSLPVDGRVRLHQKLTYGDLAQFMMLDTRQHRAPRACVTEQDWHSSVVDCPEMNAPGRTMLGGEQERWFNSNLGGGPGRWTAIIQPTLFSDVFQTDFDGKPGDYNDGWGGYRTARQTILNRISQRKVGDVVFLGGDVHAFWAADVKADFAKPESPVIASEFVGTSITAGAGGDGGYARWRRMLQMAGNEHIRFQDGRVRGYGRAEITPQRWTTEFRAVDSVWTRTPVTTTLRRFVVESGRPGVQTA